MDHLWTPWRMTYLRSDRKLDEACVFCALAADPDSVQVIARSQFVFVTLNLYPYNTGHLMVVPYQHVQTQEALAPEALADLMLTVNRSIGALRKVYNPAAFNIGANIGTAAGAGIADHYHFHVVPRWNGDANFMSVIADTRVIPDTLENTARELKAAWQELYDSTT